MSGNTLCHARGRNVVPMRAHDYLYDSSFIVSGARDYARSAFKAAMSSSQMVIQPVYKAMFSEIRNSPSMRLVYHVNCRLPTHMDNSYDAYLRKVDNVHNLPTPELGGRDRFKYTAIPKKVMSLKTASPEFHPTSPDFIAGKDNKPRNKGTQSLYRESSAQTVPWQPDAKKADGCETTPEVFYLNDLEWGPGKPYRLGDLPADFHTTEIINNWSV